MSHRLLIIILSFCIGQGILVVHAHAGNCVAGNSCMPTHDHGVNHTASENSDSCSCSLWSTQLSNHACRMDSLFQQVQQVFVRSASKHSPFYALALPSARPDHISLLNRTGPPHRLFKTDSPLSYPIYLQTLALLY